MNASDDARNVMALFRRLHGEQTDNASVSLDDAHKMLREAKSRLDRRWMPPQTNLSNNLAAVANAWRSEWTAEIRDDSQLEERSNAIERVRKLLQEERLVDASIELENFLSEFSRGARGLLTSDSVRQLQPAHRTPTDEELRQGITEMTNWLEWVQV